MELNKLSIQHINFTMEFFLQKISNILEIDFLIQTGELLEHFIHKISLQNDIIIGNHYFTI